jgi:hypothetical protein
VPPLSRRLALAVTLAFVVAVPAALGTFDSVFSSDRPHLQPPPGFTTPAVVGPATEIASGHIGAGTWHALVVRCGTGPGARASIVVVTPNGSRNSAACGAVPPGGPRPVPAFAPSTMYEGDSQTTYIYAAVAATVTQVSLDLDGRARLPGAGPSHHDIVPIDSPAARAALGLNVRFVVIAMPGDQRVVKAVARH